MATTPSSRDVYSTTNGAGVGQDSNVEIVSNEDQSSSSSSYAMADYFRGCLGELRVAGVLLPFFTEEELGNSTASRRFSIRRSEGGVASDPDRRRQCVLCFESECRNGGTCLDPLQEFSCHCPAGFEGETCEVNVDECEESRCLNGECVDGVAEYTCRCLPGWTGQL